LQISTANGVTASLQLSQASQVNWQLYNPASTTDFRLYDGAADRVVITAGSGMYLHGATGGAEGDGTLNAQGIYVNGASVYPNIPQNAQTGNYTFVLSDANKHIFINTGGTHTFTIPANSSVAFPIGTAITIINGGGSGNLTLAVTSDSLNWYPSAATGSRTLAPNSSATILKVLSTAWILTGVGIT
jgi:hypothetical protein